MKNKQKWWIAAAVMAALGNSRAWAYTPATDATITVTPIVDVSLTLSPTTYAFGSIAVNTSSVTAAALTLSNNGTIDAAVDKRIQADPADWIADTSTTTPNHYVLYVTTGATRPAETDFTNADHRFGAVGNVSPLKGVNGASPIITASAGTLPNVDLWFRLDMPIQVTTAAPQTITVRFTGTGQ